MYLLNISVKIKSFIIYNQTLSLPVQTLLYMALYMNTLARNDHAYSNPE